MREPMIGDVVQLSFGRRQMWAEGLLMIVEETKTWGVTGVVPTPQGDAPMRANFSEIVQVWHRVPDA